MIGRLYQPKSHKTAYSLIHLHYLATKVSAQLRWWYREVPPDFYATRKKFQMKKKKRFQKNNWQKWPKVEILGGPNLWMSKRINCVKKWPKFHKNWPNSSLRHIALSEPCQNPTRTLRHNRSISLVVFKYDYKKTPCVDPLCKLN